MTSPVVTWLPFACSSFATETSTMTTVRTVSPSSSVRLASLALACVRIWPASLRPNTGAIDIRNTADAMSNASIVPRPSPSGPGNAIAATTKIAMNARKRGGAMRRPRSSLKAMAQPLALGGRLA